MRPRRTRRLVRTLLAGLAYAVVAVLFQAVLLDIAPIFVLPPLFIVLLRVMLVLGLPLVLALTWIHQDVDGDE